MLECNVMPRTRVRLVLGGFLCLSMVAIAGLGRAAEQASSPATIDLLEKIDVDRDALNGKWTRSGREIVSPDIPNTFVQIPYAPPQAYRLTIIGQRDSGYDLLLKLNVGDQQVGVFIDGSYRAVTALTEVKGEWVRREVANVLGEKRDYVVVCTVHPQSLIVTVDGLPVADWVSGQGKLSLLNDWSFLPKDKLAIGGFKAVQRFKKISLEPLAPDPDINAMLRNNGITKLVHMTPVREPTVGWDQFRVNHLPQVHSAHWPYAINRAAPFCKDFLFAPAPSKLVYEIPRGFDRFSAVGFSTGGVTIRYRVFSSLNRDFANANSLYDSQACRVGNADVQLGARDRFLMLQIGDEETRGTVRSFWLRPAFSRAAKKRALTALSPVDFQVSGKFLVSQVPDNLIFPIDLTGDRRCDEFLSAHPNSRASYAIPQDAVGFSTICYCLESQSAEFVIRLDNQPDPIFKSERVGLADVNVPIRPGAKELELQVNDLGNGRDDLSFWLYPRFEFKAAGKPATKKEPTRKDSAPRAKKK
jgi:hypothetical protein